MKGAGERLHDATGDAVMTFTIASEAISFARRAHEWLDEHGDHDSLGCEVGMLCACGLWELRAALEEWLDGSDDEGGE